MEPYNYREEKRRVIIYPPSSTLVLLFLIFLFFPIFSLIGAGLITFGFRKLGLTLGQIALLLLLSLLGSFVNIPIRRKEVIVEERYEIPRIIQHLIGLPPYTVRTQVLCINVGGAIIPLVISLYIAPTIPFLPLLTSIALVAAASRFMSRVVKGVGIILPAFIPPFISAILAILLNPSNPAGLAYVAGVLGTLIGADILNLNKLRNSPGVISIGGAGIFDGIFLTGLFAAVLS